MTKVLVAEEETEARFRIEEYARGSRFEVLLASTFAEAIHFASRPGEKIEILLTTLMLLPYHGGTLANRIKASHPGMKVLFMSAVDPRQLQGGILLPGMQVLSKPFTKDSLLDSLERVRKHGHQWIEFAAKLERV